MNNLNPRMLYNKHFTKLRGAGPKEFYDSSYGNFSALNNFRVPSVELIQNRQINILKNNLKVSKERTKKFLNELNILKDGSYQWSQQDLGLFSNIEEVFGFFIGDFNNPKALEGSLKDIQDKLRRTQEIEVHDIRIVMNNISALMNALLSENVGNDIHLENDINKIENKINELNNRIANLSDSSIISKSNLTYVGTNGKTTTIFASLMGSAMRLKGRYLELKVAEFLGNKYKNVQDKFFATADTADAMGISVDILGRTTSTSKKSGTDLFITLIKKLDDIEKLSESRTFLTSTEFIEDFANEVVAGIQVKSGYNQQPFSNKKASWIDVYSGEMILIEYLYNLYVIRSYNKYQVDTNLQIPIFNPTFNYLLSKYVGNMINQNNTILATREGLQFMDEYLEKKFNEGYYIGAKKPVNIMSFDSSRTYPIGLIK